MKKVLLRVFYLSANVLFVYKASLRPLSRINRRKNLIEIGEDLMAYFQLLGLVILNLSGSFICTQSVFENSNISRILT